MSEETGHPHTIFVTNLFDMPHYVRVLTPARLVSIIQPELQPNRPPELNEPSHHRVEVHDITEEQPYSVLIQEHHVAELVSFIDEWNPADGALMTHCYAGVSRSTAAALIAAYMKLGDPTRAGISLRAAAPHAQPNRRVLELADRVLGSGTALVDAREAMGTATATFDEAPLTVLRIPPPDFPTDR